MAWKSICESTANPMSDTMREVLRQKPDDNPSSWRWTVAFFEYNAIQPNSPWAEQCTPLLRLTKYLADIEVAQKFRADQSLMDLVISSKDHHKFAITDPYIRVGTAWKDRVEYWRGGMAGNMVEGHFVMESEIIDKFMPLLDRLWSETGGHTP